jgi:hypothetical protein
MKVIVIACLMSVINCCHAQPTLVYSNALDCSYTISGKEIVNPYSGEAKLTIEIVREGKRLHAISTLSFVGSPKTITIDSFGQVDNPVVYTDKVISTYGGGSAYTTKFELNRIKGSYSVSESTRIDPFAGANWSIVTYSGVCSGNNF